MNKIETHQAIFPLRDDEPAYAYLWDKDARATNRYGNLIELVAADSELRGESLQINGNPEVGSNPNRYQQHGFFFNADNCIGCHACESACSEKNDNPAHIAFRSVGYVEGGTFPDYQRINISMACNHCDDPVCLKGCPTRAYTKFAEYGAVLQDPDICFGCGYCTWVCPYNAPQLDPVKGQVTKCNMCVDRLEVGLKPACVSACLGNALDFGVIENIPENRIEAKTEIPGFPDPSITHPNIRFQQTRSTHREMTRPDGLPVKYHRDDATGAFKPEIDAQKGGAAREWNWRKLLTSHESAHVVFTLCTQAVLGAFLLTLFGGLLSGTALAPLAATAVRAPLLVGQLALLTYGLFKLNMHLGKPHRFYRGFNNLRWSLVSREIAGITGFYTLLIGFMVLALFSHPLLVMLRQIVGIGAMLSGLAGLYFMYRIYRIPARPFWDHWQTATAFAGNAVALGALLTGVVALPALVIMGVNAAPLAAVLAALICSGQLLEAIGHAAHARAMKTLGKEGSVSWFLQTTRYYYPWLLRNGLLALNIVVTAALTLIAAAGALSGWGAILAWLLLAPGLIAAAAIGRSLFFVVVIPTTMPGAFFWKNQDFVDHARATGLVDREQVGVVRELHGRFKGDELWATIKAARPRTVLAHLKEILIWKPLPGAEHRK
ncbi:MAG: DmsC/YnfH family molybdoenzyme membrane anchor subunit [Porticoccaceae bacterium]